jgi:hypothetical protein
VRRKREQALAKARKVAERHVAALDATDPEDPAYHERRVFAETHTALVGVMEAKIREDA